jgi:hypothetical protein
MVVELSEGMQSCTVKAVPIELSGLRGDAELAEGSKSDKIINAHCHPCNNTMKLKANNMEEK